MSDILKIDVWSDWRQLHARYLSPLALEHRVPTS
jgi:hypothetical protein